jgi:xylan 1,4-beta-xylosidase
MKLTRGLSALAILAALTGSLCAQPRPVTFDWFEYSGMNALETKVGPGEYQNPILTGFYPDPSICRAGDDFYLINSTFAYFPGIPIFHSRDLVNWKQVGHVIHRPEQLRYDRVGVSGGIFAPAIEYHDGIFYVVCTQVGGNGNFVVTATNAAGPWSQPTELRFEGIDPSIFFDDDGRAWMVNNGAPEGRSLYEGHRAVWIQEFDYKEKKMIGPRKVLVNGGVDISKKPIWIEGPHIYKVNGWYYLNCAEGGTGPQHSQVILRSKNVDGPYMPWEKNPILTQRDLSANAPDASTCTGHADLVIGPDNNWWAVFLAVRPYQGRFSPMGRETYLLPVKWTDDGWPVILPPGERVPMVAKSPGGVSVQPSASLPLNGNFTWRDDFNDASLSPAWIMLRTPKETWWKNEAGKLHLTPRAELLSGRGNPSFFGRRVQHVRFSAALAVDVPGAPGITAGLAVFQGERHHYFANVTRVTNGVTVSLERLRGRGDAEVVKTLSLASAQTIKFRIKASDATCGFEYAVDGGNWETLASDQDATLLTTDVAGGFVGATVGPHVRTADAGQSANPANARADNSRAIPTVSADARGIRINAGSPTPFTDSTGNVWLPDQGFDGGSVIDRESIAITGSKESHLFASERYGMSSFAVRIPNGKYVAKLHFAETYDGISGPGQRVFSFNLQGREFKDFDVWAKTGGLNRAHVETVPVEITNGVFRINFTSQVENPQINAIEILPQS